MKELINNFLITKKIIRTYYKKNTFFLNFLFIVQSILEVITIFLVLLLLKQILNIETAIFNKFGILLNKNEMVMYLSLFTLSFLILSFFLNLHINRKIINFSYGIYAEIVKKTFDNFISADYINISSMSYSFVSSRLLNETRRLCELVIVPYLMVISKLVVLILITIGLIIYKPFVSITSIALIGVIFTIFYYFTRSKNIHHGKQISTLDKKMLSIVNNAFYGFKELKLNNLNKNFNQDFETNQKNLAKTLMMIKFIHSSARYFIELAIFSIFIITIMYLNYKNLLNSDAISVMAFYLFVILKILPYINVVYLNFSLWKTHYHALESVDDFNKKLSYRKTYLNDQSTIKNYLDEIKEIELKKFTYEYNENRKVINLNQDIKFKKKTIIGLKGDSGSGKTTLLDIISGLITITNEKNGGVYLNNKNINEFYKKEYFKKISYVQQRVFLLQDTIKNNIILDKKYDNKLFEKVLDLSCCTNFLRERTKDNHSRVDELISFGRENFSGGQIQRIGIARALYKSPKIIFLDEATNALDEKLENIILKNIFEMENIDFIFISAHNHKILEKCDIILEFKEGLVKQV